MNKKELIDFANYNADGSHLGSNKNFLHSPKPQPLNLSPRVKKRGKKGNKHFKNPTSPNSARISGKAGAHKGRAAEDENALALIPIPPEGVNALVLHSGPVYM